MFKEIILLLCVSLKKIDAGYKICIQKKCKKINQYKIIHRIRKILFQLLLNIIKTDNLPKIYLIKKILKLL
jgi:hypothetical protein